MKKALSKVLAIIVTVALMATASIIMTATAEDDVVTNYLTLLPENYEAADKIFDAANESHSRVTMTNWKFWGGSAAYPTLEDQYGLTRVNADYAYLDIAVLSETEYFAVGMMVHKNYFQNGKYENYYYVSENGENWKPIQPIGTAVPEISPHYSVNFADTDYRVEVDVIGNLPEGSNYVRVLTVCPSAAWTPILDFVNVYDLGYNYAVSLYPETPVVSIEEPRWDTADMEKVNATVSNLKQVANALNYRAELNTFGLEDPAQPGYVTMDANNRNSIEAAFIFEKNRQMSVSFEYKASIAVDAEWLPLGSDSIAMKQLNNADAASTSIQGNTNYEVYAYRLYNLPENILSVRIKLVGSAGVTWVPLIDYIDIYENPITESEETRFAAAFDGYKDSATAVYFDDKTTNHAGVVTLNNVTVGSKGMGTRNGVDWSATVSNITDAYVVVPVNSSNVIEAGLRVASDRANDISLSFYASADANNWVKISDANDFVITETTTTSYPVERYRVTNLPNGTAFLKIKFEVGTTWAQTLDYVDVYDVNPFDFALDGYEKTKTIEEGDADLAEKTLEVNNLVKGTGGGGVVYYRMDNINYFKPNGSVNGYVSFAANENTVVETTTVFDMNNASVMLAKFYYATNENVESLADADWTELPEGSVAVKNMGKFRTDGVQIASATSNYQAFTYRLYNLPEGTTAIKVEIGTRGWAPTIDY
ncbi:MAG: hypothetical protein J6V50_01665, partial [Clostridia bacterium]|nr:hypothetical protein [Clostridia bacterium]